MIDAKALKKIATACRKAGIKKYTCPEFSFELSDEAPVSRQKSRRNGGVVTVKENFTVEADVEQELSGDALLFWSTDVTGQQ